MWNRKATPAPELPDPRSFEPEELPENDPSLPATERCLLIMERMWARRFRAESARQYTDALETKLRREYREETAALRADLKALREAVVETVPEQPEKLLSSAEPDVIEQIKDLAKQGRTFSVNVHKVPATMRVKLPAVNSRRNP